MKRRCDNCVHWGGEPGVTTGTDRAPCLYPVPLYIAVFFTLARGMLATDGEFCMMHKLDGEP
jgi:hypothetical protein